MNRTCPNCGSGLVRQSEGCETCLACGWSVCADGGGDQEELWRDDEERFVEYRAAFLDKQHGIERKKARVLALSEIGYSVSGIAAEVEHTEGTIDGYLDELEVAWGPETVRTKLPEEIAVDAPLEPVTEEELLGKPKAVRERWRDLAEKHRTVAPDWWGGVA